MFDIKVGVENGALAVIVTFGLHAADVIPTQTMSDVTTSFYGLLMDSSGQLGDVLSTFGSGFNSPIALFTSISNELVLSLNADLTTEVKLLADLDVKFFTPGIMSFTTVNEMSMSLLAAMNDPFVVAIDNVNIHVAPSVQLRMSAENTALPIDVIANPSSLGDFAFTGDFDGTVNIALAGVPTNITMRAYSPDLLAQDSLAFGLGLDIDLVPIQQSEYIPSSHLVHILFIPLLNTAVLSSLALGAVLDQMADIAYPPWLLDAAVYLPKLDLTCIADSGKTFLNKAVRKSTAATVSGFFSAIQAGCSSSFEALVLSGGYVTSSEELRMDLVVETKTGRSV